MNTDADQSGSAPNEAKSRLTVVAAVVQENGRFLICQRPPHKRHGNLWEFPGGKLEPGESFFDAIRRELFEELALTALSIGAPRQTILEPEFEINFIDTFVQGHPIPHEHISVAWATIEELLKLPLAPSDFQFVQELAKTKS